MYIGSIWIDPIGVLCDMKEGMIWFFLTHEGVDTYIKNCKIETKEEKQLAHEMYTSFLDCMPPVYTWDAPVKKLHSQDGFHAYSQLQ